MKVLFLTHLYPPTGIGGTEVYTHGLARGLMRLGHEPRVVCTDEWESGGPHWGSPGDRVHEGVPVHGLRLDWRHAPRVNRSLYDNPQVGQYLTGYLAHARPDIVHVTSCITLSTSVMRAVKQAGLPLILTLTDFWFLCPRITLLRSDGRACDGHVPTEECAECLLRGTRPLQWLDRLLPRSSAVRLLSAAGRYEPLARRPWLRGRTLDVAERRTTLEAALALADRVLIASESGRDLFVLNGFSRRLDVVHYGHDLAWLARYRGKTPSDRLRVGFIGQVAAMKGPDLLIEAYRQATTPAEARLYIYGNVDRDTAFGDRLRRLAAGRSDIEFRGTYAHADSATVFSDIDVLVVPSLWHDYPLIIREAFATGTPVIASDFGGMKEAVRHDVDGLLFERGSAEDLARQLRRLLVDDPLLARLRQGAPHVKSMDEAVDEMARIYRDVLDSVETRPAG